MSIKLFILFKMSYQEKRTVVSILSGLTLLFVYCNRILTQYNLTNSTDLKFWAESMLIFVGISIVLMIVIQIVFHILLSISIAVSESITAKEHKVNEELIDKKIKSEMVEDERDHLIELKSYRVGYFLTGFGFIFALVSILLDYPAAIMLNVLFFSFMIGSIVEGFTQLIYYKKG